MSRPDPIIERRLAVLEAGLDAIRAAPADRGRVEMIVRRPALGVREVLDEGVLDPVVGLVGDTWSARPSRRTADGGPHPDMQLNLMGVRAAGVIAGDRSRWPLAGDQLFVDLDLGVVALPAGTRLAIGGAVIEVTDAPHLGCAKFSARFGPEALRFVNLPDARLLRVRGACTRVVSGGVIRVGDEIRMT